MKVKVAISAHHIHLTKKDLDILFGENYELHKRNDLSQKGQFASLETVKIKTLKGEMVLRVLGPVRDYTQAEVSKTDAYKLGINPPVRNSGDIIGSEKVTIIGPNGIIEDKECCIIADRHIHVTKEHRKLYGLEDKEYVSVLVPGEKGGILSNVRIKETEKAYYEMHIDTDDANAFLIKNGDIVEII